MIFCLPTLIGVAWQLLTAFKIGVVSVFNKVLLTDWRVFWVTAGLAAGCVASRITCCINNGLLHAGMFAAETLKPSNTASQQVQTFIASSIPNTPFFSHGKVGLFYYSVYK